MLTKNNTIIKSIWLKFTEVKYISHGNSEFYPGLISTQTGIDYTGWIYNLPTRVRTATPFTVYVYQNNTSKKVYGTASQTTETGVIGWDDPNVWSYFSNNSYRTKLKTAFYTFPDSTVMYSQDTITEREDGVDTSTWVYSGSTRTKAVKYLYTDGVIKNGQSLFEQGVTTLDLGNWRYDTMPQKRQRTVTPYYDFSQYLPVIQKEGDWYFQDDFPVNTTSNTVYHYDLDNRASTMLNHFSNGDTWGPPPNVEIPTNIQIFSLEEYDNGECDNVTHEYVDYLQVRKQYTWSGVPTSTFGPTQNGTERRQKIPGQCGYIRAYTEWVQTGESCNATGGIGYSCDGDYSVTYNRERRYFQYPDGAQRTTEYRAGSEASRMQVNGQCGYPTGTPRTPIEIFGYDEYSIADAYYNNMIGFLYLDPNDGIYYTDELNYQPWNGGVYVTFRGDTAESSEYLRIYQ